MDAKLENEAKEVKLALDQREAEVDALLEAFSAKLMQRVDVAIQEVVGDTEERLNQALEARVTDAEDALKAKCAEVGEDAASSVTALKKELMKELAGIRSDAAAAHEALAGQIRDTGESASADLTGLRAELGTAIQRGVTDMAREMREESGEARGRNEVAMEDLRADSAKQRESLSEKLGQKMDADVAALHEALAAAKRQLWYAYGVLALTLAAVAIKAFWG